MSFEWIIKNIYKGISGEIFEMFSKRILKQSLDAFHLHFRIPSVFTEEIQEKIFEGICWKIFVYVISGLLEVESLTIVLRLIGVAFKKILVNISKQTSFAHAFCFKTIYFI